MNGNLKPGIKDEGQYCYFRHQLGMKWTFEESKTACESLSGTLPILKSLEAQTIFYTDKCSTMDQQFPGERQCTGVSNRK